MRQAVIDKKKAGFSTEELVWAFAFLLHALFWLSLRTHWLVPLFNDSVHRFGPGADFFALYQAGYSAMRGQSIYSFTETAIPYAYPFRYLPVSAYTVGPLLALLPPTWAYALWLGICELFLIRNVKLTHQLSGGGTRGALLGAIWLTFCPYFLELWVGQFTFILGSLLFWTVLAVERGAVRAGQGWWITSVMWKPASLLWLPLWLRERRYWPGLVVCGVGLLANLVYFRFFPQDWAVFLETNLNPVPTWHAGNVGLSGLIYHFTGNGANFRLVRSALTLALLVPAFWVTWRRRAAPFWLLAAVWTSLYYLIYKDVWEHHTTLLLPFLVLCLWRTPSWWIGGLTLLLALPSPFIFYDIPQLGFNVDPQPFFSSNVSLLHHSWRVVPLVLVYAHLVWLASRPERWERKTPQEATRD